MLLMTGHLCIYNCVLAPAECCCILWWILCKAPYWRGPQMLIYLQITAQSAFLILNEPLVVKTVGRDGVFYFWNVSWKIIRLKTLWEIRRVSSEPLCVFKKSLNLALGPQLTTFSRVRLSLSEAKTPMNETKNMTTPRTMRITAGAKNTPSSVL